MDDLEASLLEKPVEPEKLIPANVLSNKKVIQFWLG
jgi:hypothetical protein